MDRLVSDPSLTVCICTMDRTDVLRRCLESIANGSSRPDAIVVSDDSRDGAATAEVCREFSVTYIKGPRQGLCGNRNSVVRQAATTHVSLLDDDAVVSSEFVAQARSLIQDSPDDVIITGIVNEEGNQIIPFNATFLGHFGKPPADRFENVNLNCNIFPRRAFDIASFDEAIGFGYEDMDLCSHLRFAGFRIQFNPQLQNTHMPPKRAGGSGEARFLRTERARFYTSVKRYMLWNKNYLTLFTYLAAAPAHRALSAIKCGNWGDLKHCVPDMVAATRGSLRAKAMLKQRAVNPALEHSQ